MSRGAVARQRLQEWSRRHVQDDIDAIASEVHTFLQEVIPHQRQEQEVEEAARDLLFEVLYLQTSLLVTEVFDPPSRLLSPPPPPSIPAVPRLKVKRYLDNKPLRRGDRSFSRPLP